MTFLSQGIPPACPNPQYGQLPHGVPSLLNSQPKTWTGQSAGPPPGLPTVGSSTWSPEARAAGYLGAGAAVVGGLTVAGVLGGRKIHKAAIARSTGESGWNGLN